jgi:hypothetical protein
MSVPDEMTKRSFSWGVYLRTERLAKPATRRMMTPPKYLLEALEAKECVLFIGSGVSQWSGLPSWDGLLLRMLAFLDDRGLAAHERAEIESVIGTGDLLTAASLSQLG